MAPKKAEKTKSVEFGKDDTYASNKQVHLATTEKKTGAGTVFLIILHSAFVNGLTVYLSNWGQQTY